MEWPHTIRLLDRTDQPLEGDVLAPFALDELLCREVGEGAEPVLHLWRHQRAFVLGLRDRRLPGAEQAMRWLEEQGYKVGVRNSGGAAVPLDEGVVNASLIVPNPRSSFQLQPDYERMAAMIAGSLQGNGVVVGSGEVEGAYCPGDYDLSIRGLKFCGIAQRRQVRATSIQAFVVVEGSGTERARLVQAFYNRAAGRDLENRVRESRDNRELNNAGGFPQVVPERHGSVRELAGAGSCEEYADSLSRWLGERVKLVGMVVPEELQIRVPGLADELRSRYDQRKS